MYLYLKYTVYVCSLSGPGLAPGVLSYFYTQHSTLKPARLIMPRQNRKKVRDISRGGRSPEERPYDVSRGQNRCVTLP